MQALLDQFAKLGLSHNEALTYLALLRESPATGYAVMKRSGLSRGQIYETLNRLVAHGAAQVTLDGKFLPMPFEQFASTKLAGMKQAIEHIGAELPKLLGERTDIAVMVLGRRALLERATDMLRKARFHVYASGFAEELEEIRDTLIDAHDRGLEVNVVTCNPFELKGIPIHRDAGGEIYVQTKHGRTFNLVVDRAEGLMGVFAEDGSANGLWSQNDYFCTAILTAISFKILALRLFACLGSTSREALKRELSDITSRTALVSVPGMVDDRHDLTAYWNAAGKPAR